MSNELRRPLTALLLAPDPQVWTDVLLGKKRITVREGHRDYREETAAVLCSHELNVALMIDITSVRHCLLSELTEEELASDGFLDHKDCVMQLRQFYPDIDLFSPVTVIRWDNVCGDMVDRLNTRIEE